MRIETIESTSERAGLKLTPEITEQIRRYIELLLEKNKVMNLTAITEEKAVAESHLLDSFCLLPYLRGNSLIDVGTGAGIPGLLIKLLCPDMKVVLLDATRKRIDFLNEVITDLGLSGVTAVHGRAEELAHNADYREKFDIVVARAVSPLDILTELCLPLAKQGGRFLAMKGRDDELTLARRAIGLLGGGRPSADHYFLPDTDIARSIVIVPKEKPTKQRYPRSFATIKTSPL